MIFIIKELIERMIFYYGVSRGYNIGLADSILIELYDHSVEQDRINGKYTREYSSEINARGELINLIIHINNLQNMDNRNIIENTIMNHGNIKRYQISIKKHPKNRKSKFQK